MMKKLLAEGSDEARASESTKGQARAHTARTATVESQARNVISQGRSEEAVLALAPSNDSDTSSSTSSLSDSDSSSSSDSDTD